MKKNEKEEIMTKSVDIAFNKEYKDWLKEIKVKIQSSQIKAAIAVNRALIEFYWDLGEMIADKQKHNNWGSKLIEQLSKDLKREFPEMSGFSRRNLYYVAQFYTYFSKFSIVPQLEAQKESPIIPRVEGQNKSQIILQLLGQLPWGHIKVLTSKIKDDIEAEFALRDINKPMGISEYTFTEIIPENLKSSLPTIEELENELKKE